MKSYTLELQFSVECLKRFLLQNPDNAKELALSYFEERPRVADRRKGMRDEDFSVLAAEYKRLEQDFHAMQSQLIQLQQQNSQVRKSPQLPHFLRK